MQVISGGLQESNQQTRNATPRISQQPLPSVGPVQNFSELCAAFGLVHDEYVVQGYMNPSHHGMRYSFRNLERTAQTFVARCEGEIIGTVTTVLDSDVGLPLQDIFPEAIAELRRQGRYVVEGTMFAHLAHSADASTQIELLAQALAWSMQNRVDDFCVVVNPKHAGFYIKLLGFEVVAEERSCDSVESAPGVLLRLKLKELASGQIAMTSFAKKIISACPASKVLLMVVYHLQERERDLLARFLEEGDFIESMQVNS